YSVAKPLAATCVLLLVERGLIGLDDRVAAHWPEFAAAGKDRVTVRQVLAHQAGLDLFEQRLPPEVLLDWEAATTLLAASPPRWPPGSTHGEHAAFYGHLVGELVRRVDGRTLGAFLREEIASPWGLDFHVGLRGSELARAADVVDPGGACRAEALSRGEAFRLAVDNPPAMLHPDVVNGDAWRRAEIPAVNGHGTALALARFYSGLGAGGVLEGVRLLSDDLVAEATRPQRIGHDEVLGEEASWGLGFGIGDGGFGMGGLGGSLGWWAGEGYACAYVTRRLGGFERCEAIEAALRRCLGLSAVSL
ncbi:MAG: serine hydrolase domain-containing protein, partial [Gaiellales bacterium]